MRFSFFRLVTLALAAAFVAAESELAHAMEVVFMYSKYQTEGLAYSKGPYWVAPHCADGLNRRCTFNEFVSYLKYGNRQTGPAIIELNGQFNWLDRNAVQRVVTKMAAMKDPSDPSGQRLLMAGDMPASRVINGVRGITELFNKFKDFDRLVTLDIDAMPDGATKTNAKASLDTTNKILLEANSLRSATRSQKVHDEMTTKFSPTGKLDKVYEYQKDGKTLRFDPIQWSIDKVTLWGREFQKINVENTKAKNPQLSDPILWDRVENHLKLFNTDGEDGKGKGLVKYDPRYAGTNARHQHIINIQRSVADAYIKGCK